MKANRTLTLAGLLLALVPPTVSACGIQATGITVLSQAPAAVGSTQQESPSTAAGTSQYLLFFFQGDRLTPTYRTANGAATEEIVLNALIAGPTATEMKQGLTSALPRDLVAKTRADGYAAAYLISEPLDSDAKAQFICTMQSFDGSRSVGTQVDGAAKQPTWIGCSDTTNYYVPMQGDNFPQSSLGSVRNN